MAWAGTAAKGVTGLLGKAAGASGLSEGALGGMMKKGQSQAGGKAYDIGLNGGMGALSQYHDMSNVGEKSMLDPQMVFGMMNNTAYKPQQQRRDIHPQWAYNNMQNRNPPRGLL